MGPESAEIYFDFQTTPEATMEILTGPPLINDITCVCVFCEGPPGIISIRVEFAGWKKEGVRRGDFFLSFTQSSDGRRTRRLCGKERRARIGHEGAANSFPGGATSPSARGLFSPCLLLPYPGKLPKLPRDFLAAGDAGGDPLPAEYMVARGGEKA